MLNAIDTDVIKAYVEQGLGVAIVAKMAYDAKRDRGLRALDASRLFESNTVHLGFRRNNHLRRFALDFIELLVPQLNRKTGVSWVLEKLKKALPRAAFETLCPRKPDAKAVGY